MSNGTRWVLLLAAWMAACSSDGAVGDGNGSPGGTSGSGSTSSNGATGSGAGGSTGSGSTGSLGGSGPNGGAGNPGGGVSNGGGVPNGTGGTSGTGGIGSPTGGSGNAGTPVVAVDETPGRWRTALDPATGRFRFLSPDGTPAVLRGVSMTGPETGTRETASGAGFWLFSSGQSPEATNAPQVFKNVVRTLATKWKNTVVRIPICGSAWAQNYVVHDWGNARVATYREWIDGAVREARSHGAVVIIDNHLWAIARMGNGGGVDRGTFTSNGQTRQYRDYEDGCTGINEVGGVDSCAPSDWYVEAADVWQCAIANADGVTMHNAYKNQAHIADMWADIASRYKDDSGVWFELFNEPYSRKATTPFPSAGENEEAADYPWDLWAEFMQTQISAIRDRSQASNIILVGGLDWGYDFGPEHGPIARPATFLPWASQYPSIAYVFHPYQHGSCCGQIGAEGTDLSATDPYQSGFCSYYPGGADWGDASGAALPGGKACTNKGYAATQDKKMPPCTWVATAWNPGTNAPGLCAGDRALCGPKSQAECEATDRTSPEAGGWSRYVLPMAKFGPLVATEFGSFDCSSAYVKTLLRYMNELGISYTAWALWPQNSGGPEGLGSCGYPALMRPTADPGDFRQCLDEAACASLMEPLPWAGMATFEDLTSR